MKQIKAIIFDLDNTLIDFMSFKWKATNAAVTAMIKAGLNVDKKKVMRIVKELYDRHGIEYQKVFDDLLKQTIGHVDQRILAAGVVAYKRVKGDMLQTYPNAVPVLKKLKKRVPSIGVVSDAPKFQAWTRLFEMKLDKYFDFVLTPEDTKAFKPSGLPFKKVIEVLKVKPHEVLAIGDWMSRDVLPAKKLGMKTVLARYGNTTHEPGKADYEIDNIKELLKIVK